MYIWPIQSLLSKKKNMEKLLIRNICQPKNSNPYGTGHGGWVITQMAQGGIYMTQLISKGNAVLVESNIKYKNPMHVGKFLNVYGSIKSVKQSKMVLKITAKRSEMDQKEVVVASGEFSFVAINAKNKARKFKPNLKI